MLTERFAVRLFWLHLAAVVLCCAPGRAFSANLDTVADHVIGQSNFTSSLINQGGPISATGMGQPFYAAIDRRNGRIWIIDNGNSRVLNYPSAAAMANGAAADFVLGQPNLTSGTANNGGLSASSLFDPQGVAVDAAGNVFVADSHNNRVLMYTQPLTTDAIADVVIGQADFTTSATGTTAATFNSPTRVALDRDGNLYVADFNNSRVLRYAPPFVNGMNATLVLGQPDFVSGLANNGGISASSLFKPQDMAFDSSNNLYVADVFNHRVLEYNAGFGTNSAASRVYGQAGSFTTNTANNGGVSASSLNTPRGVSLDPFNNVYISDSVNNRVLQFAGTSTTASLVFGQPDFTTTTAGAASATSLNAPVACVSDNIGNLLIVDGTNFRVLEYDLPITPSAPTITATFPTVMAAGSSDFVLYLTGKNFISTSLVQVNGAAGPTTFKDFASLSATIPAAAVANPGIAAITVFTPAPGGGTSVITPLTVYARNPNDTIADRILGQPNFTTADSNNGGISAHSMAIPYDMTIDSTGRLWITDIGNNRVLSWANADALTDGKDADFVLGQNDFSTNLSGTSATALRGPGGVVVDAAGNVYVADTSNARVLIFNDPLHTDRVADVVLGQADFLGNAPHEGGAVSAAGFSQPFGLALDPAGNLYVVDYGDSRVLRFAPPFVTNMNASQVFGQPNFTSNTANNGGISASTLNAPGYAKVDAAGNLYVTDYTNNRVLVYNTPLSSDTVADRVFGQPNFTTSTANTGGISAQTMNNPDGIAFDAAGNLYISDQANHRILVFFSPLTSTGTANRVFGQGGNFTSNNANNGGRSAGSLRLPTGLALDAKGNLYVCDNFNNRILSYDHPLESTPLIASAAQALPSTVLVGQPVTFTAAATDPDDDALTYTWDFGDGTSATGASVSHAYLVAGIINATVTIDDGNGGTATSSVMVTVKAPNPLGDVKLAVKLNFKKSNSDSISASGTLELPAGPITGAITVQIADLLESFTLVGSKAKNADGTFSLNSKGTGARAAKFSLKLSKKTFAPSFLSAGLVNSTVTGAPIQVPVTLTLNGAVYQTVVPLKYTAKQGASGKTK